MNLSGVIWVAYGLVLRKTSLQIGDGGNVFVDMDKRIFVHIRFGQNKLLNDENMLQQFPKIEITLERIITNIDPRFESAVSLFDEMLLYKGFDGIIAIQRFFAKYFIFDFFIFANVLILAVFYHFHGLRL